LLCGGDNLSAQLHLTLQQLCVEPLHQLLLDLTLKQSNKLIFWGVIKFDENFKNQ
jgi:hypothetical protein